MKTFNLLTSLIFAHGLVTASPAASGSGGVLGSTAASSSVAASSAVEPSSSAAARNSVVPSSSANMSLPPAAASAIAEPEATQAFNLITTDDATFLKFEESSIKFPSYKISGHSYLKLYKNGHYESYGILRNDAAGKSYNAAFWWTVKDSKGHTYWFGSNNKCGPYKGLKHRGDVCEWSEYNYSEELYNHWKDIKTKHKAVEYPIEYSSTSI